MKILGESSTHNPIGYNLSKPRIFIKFDKRLLLLFDTRGNFFYIVTCAGVVKLVDARDSKSREPQAHVGSIPTSGTNYFNKLGSCQRSCL